MKISTTSAKTRLISQSCSVHDGRGDETLQEGETEEDWTSSTYRGTQRAKNAKSLQRCVDMEVSGV